MLPYVADDRATQPVTLTVRGIPPSAAIWSGRQRPGPARLGPARLRHKDFEAAGPGTASLVLLPVAKTPGAGAPGVAPGLGRGLNAADRGGFVVKELTVRGGVSKSGSLPGGGTMRGSGRGAQGVRVRGTDPRVRGTDPCRPLPVRGPTALRLPRVAEAGMDVGGIGRPPRPRARQRFGRTLRRGARHPERHAPV